jgi:hypothetical protein
MDRTWERCAVDGPPDDDVGATDVSVLAAAAQAVHGTGEGVRTLDGESLMGRAHELEMLRRAVDAASAGVTAELEARGVTDLLTGFRTRAWLAIDGHLPREVANQRVKSAMLLRRCDELAAALRDGRIGADHVRLIADATNDRNLDVVVSLQECLVDMVEEFPRFEPWAVRVRALLRLADVDGGHDPRPEDNRLHLSRGMEGDLQVDGSFVGEHALAVQATLERMADELFARSVRDREQAGSDIPMPSRATLLALAFVECCRLAAGNDGSPASPATDVTLVIHAQDPGQARTPDGDVVDRATTNLLTCDGVFHPLLVDGGGVPLDLGRDVRFANRDQRRAVRQRDGGCVFPGCDAPARWTDVHHVVHWEDGGGSDLHNLACLCRHHHGVVHRTGWSMEEVADQWFRIVTPSGRVLRSQRHGRPAPP